MLSELLINNLKDAATKATLNAYVPYSCFKVGASLALQDGTILRAANIENASYGLSMCAERCVLYQAVNKGYKKDDILALCVIADTKKPVSPCGACRQVMAELMHQDADVILMNNKGDVLKYKVRDLLPYPFLESDLTDV